MSKAAGALFDLTGKVAVVTGGGSGLGREFCDVLAEYGADVICADIHMERAKETCRIIERFRHKAVAIETDVTKYDQVHAMFAQVMHTSGKLDILVNNAGISLPSVTIGQIELKDWHDVIDVNLHGVFYCLKEGLEIMRQQKAGAVVNIASIFGLCAADPAIVSVPPYVASKFAVVGLTKEAAAEYGQYGVRVNCIAPGFFLGTRLGQRTKALAPPPAAGQRAEALASRAPLKRTGKPQELKGLLLFLVSESSSFVTGQVIAEDGGWTIW
jgi:NAD(P)-dependent dehydrogenase (short-subunit alcohol dehydrogenase family)